MQLITFTIDVYSALTGLSFINTNKKKSHIVFFSNQDGTDNSGFSSKFKSQ